MYIVLAVEEVHDEDNGEMISCSNYHIHLTLLTFLYSLKCERCSMFHHTIRKPSQAGSLLPTQRKLRACASTCANANKMQGRLQRLKRDTTTPFGHPTSTLANLTEEFKKRTTVSRGNSSMLCTGGLCTPLRLRLRRPPGLGPLQRGEARQAGQMSNCCSRDAEYRYGGITGSVLRGYCRCSCSCFTCADI